MVNVKSKSCAHHGCTKWPSYGNAGSRAEYCRDHAEDGMANVNQRCASRGCTTRASYSEDNTGTQKFCARHAEEDKVGVSGQSSGDSKRSGRTDGTGVRGSGTAGRAGSDGRRRSRAPSPTRAESSSGRSRETNKRARRNAGGRDTYPVRVKREGADSGVPDDEKRNAFSEPDAVVKTEDMEVSCKAEHVEATGSTRAARMERRKPTRGKARGF